MRSRYIFTLVKSGSYITVIGSTLRSQEQKSVTCDTTTKGMIESMIVTAVMASPFQSFRGTWQMLMEAGVKV